MSLYPVLRRSGFPSGLDFWRFGDVDRVFDRILGSVGRDNGSWFPAVDVKETSDEITFHAELPGLKAEDGKVQLAGGSALRPRAKVTIASVSGATGSLSAASHCPSRPTLRRSARSTATGC